MRVDGKVADARHRRWIPAKQRITVGGRAVKLQERRWLAFHKPLGVVTTASDEEGRRTVLDFIPETAGLTYVGRLDVMTTGSCCSPPTARRCTGSPTRATTSRAATPRWCTAGPTAEIAAGGASSGS